MYHLPDRRVPIMAIQHVVSAGLRLWMAEMPLSVLAPFRDICNMSLVVIESVRFGIARKPMNGNGGFHSAVLQWRTRELPFL